MSRTRASLGYLRRPGPLVVVSLLYLLLVSGVMIWRGISVSPDYLLLVLVPVALLSGRFVGFLRDWVPFMALFLGYEALGGVAPKTGMAGIAAQAGTPERTGLAPPRGMAPRGEAAATAGTAPKAGTAG